MGLLLLFYMVKIGVTGGIGSGKSTVCRVFKEMGVPVYEADKRAKQVILKEEVKVKVKELLGEEAYLENGNINRDHIAKNVFSDMEKREALNTIIHPAVAKDYKDWLNEVKDEPMVIKEAALFFEIGSELEMDHMILVVADLEQRIARVLKRDAFRSREELMNIIATQLPDEEKIKQAGFVIRNNEEDALLPQINDVFEKLKGE